MTIKPKDQKSHPDNWNQIRQQILDRAHNHCENCGVLNGLATWNGHKWNNVVLTIAHLDHDPTNNDPSNLRALCQRCHLQYDAEHHAATRRKTKADSDKSLTLDFNPE